MTFTWASGRVAVGVPATSANLGPGFDSFGLALTLRDYVVARVTSGGLDIRIDGPGAELADAGEELLVVRAMRAVFDVLGTQPPGLAVSCENSIPHGFGLGSSAAAIVAGLLAARELAADEGTALPDSAVLGMAAELEGHADNVAACMLGGLTIAWRPGPEGPWPGRDPVPVAVARLQPHPELAPVVCVPAVPLPTQEARQVLPVQVLHADAAANAARAALLVAGMINWPDLLLPGTEDFLHQRYRADSMPATTALVARLRSAGIAAAVSGAGPAVLALAADTDEAAAVASLAAMEKDAWEVLALRVDTDGAQLLG
ncbi:MAG TPA: homoserine kinase [Streptosporangiaceae bacterium]|nr:homoserine kinase [Streptosporangiaceae bacterium]